MSNNTKNKNTLRILYNSIREIDNNEISDAVGIALDSDASAFINVSNLQADALCRCDEIVDAIIKIL